MCNQLNTKVINPSKYNYMYSSVCVYVCVCVYVYVCVYMCVCICVCVYACCILIKYYLMYICITR